MALRSRSSWRLLCLTPGPSGNHSAPLIATPMSTWLSGDDLNLANPPVLTGAHAVDLHPQTIARPNDMRTERRQPMP